MKTYLYIFLTFIGLTLSSCNDWLDVSSESEKKEDNLFEEEDGFKSALTGVYIKLANTNLYGKNMSYFIPELLAQHWTLTSTTTTDLEYRLYEFDYTATVTENRIKIVFLEYYNAILQINSILEKIDEKEDIFHYGNYELIKGEALALRGFLHFELLRAFGPIPGTSANGKLSIPYVDKVTNNPLELLSLPYEEVVKNIIADLEAAEKLLINDPVNQTTLPIINRWYGYTTNLPDDSFQYYRSNRLNYNAIQAIKARYYLWIGDTTQAVKYAKEVIEMTEEDETPKYALATETYFATGGKDGLSSISLTMNAESLFSLHNSNHYTEIEKDFIATRPTLTQNENYVYEAYGSGLNPDDIRNKGSRYWSYINVSGENSFYVYLKYTGNDQIENANTIPVIRLAEMYLILVECLPLEEAKKYLEEFRIARNLSPEYIESFTEETRLEFVESEYRKEFFGEGQMFYFFKRHAYPSLSWPVLLEMNLENYVIPKPETQTIFE